MPFVATTPSAWPPASISAPFSVIAPTVIVPPTVVNDAISTSQKVPVVVSVLSNDISGTTGSEMEPMLHSTLRLTANPAHGTASVNTATDAVTYTPSGLYHCADSLVCKICDANANCDQVTVSVTVSHDANTIQNSSNGGCVDLAPAVVDHCERRISQPSNVCATPQLHWLGQHNVACVQCFDANRPVL